jgi:hypothetical protein
MACVRQRAPRSSVEHSSGRKVRLTEDVHAEFLHTRHATGQLGADLGLRISRGRESICCKAGSVDSGPVDSAKTSA